jgi:thiol-disulfide isomerase/thioredoxin
MTKKLSVYLGPEKKLFSPISICNMKLRYFILILGLLIAITAYTQSEAEARSDVPETGAYLHMAPFKIVSLTDNSMIDSSQLAGKVLLVSFFASWCPPCLHEIPSLIALQNSFKSQGFSVIAFSLDKGNLTGLKNIVAKQGINYPVLLADPAVTRSFEGVTGIPMSYLVNRRGEIVKRFVGLVSHDSLEEAIENLLAAD